MVNDGKFNAEKWLATRDNSEPALHITQQRLPGSEDSTQICPDCNGYGRLLPGNLRLEEAVKCESCNGSGKLPLT